jgi:hypothetical protein
MRPMEHSAVGQPPVSETPRTDVTATNTAEQTLDTLHIEHTKLPSLGSGPIFPFSWLIELFKRATSAR